MKPFILAMQFLTSFYLPVAVDFTDENLRKSVFFFPWIGVILGYLLYFISSFFKNQAIKGLVLLILWLVFTGAMHLDGLSDTVDGFFARKDREKTLEIMKDSRIGAFGVISLVLVLLTKYVLLTQIDLNPTTLAGVLGGARLSNAFVIGLVPSARPDGMGKMLQQTKPLPYILVSALLFIIFLFLMDKSLFLVLLGQMLIVGLIVFVSIKKIKGVTGDIYGADVEIAEAFGLLLIGLM